VLRYLSTNNITGVRGNHDQKVIEWRGWLVWIKSLPGGLTWLEQVERKWNESWNEEEEAELGAWIEQQRCLSSPSSDKKWWKLVPKGWKLLGDHYKIARDISDQDFQYLLSLPLRLYVPSAHVFIAHGGVLSSDPRYAMNDKTKQPLARFPTLPGRRHFDDSSKKVEALRELQDLHILMEIPQNKDPWVTLNMRSIRDGKVSRASDQGTPWTDMWAKQMKSCVGYGTSFEEDSDGIFVLKKHYSLPCYPSTTIYGHAASRGLDIKRWSFGLDTGCVSGRSACRPGYYSIQCRCTRGICPPSSSLGTEL